MKLNRLWLLAAVSLFCTGCDQIPKWTIVTDPQGHYGYVSWDGEVNGGYRTRKEAEAARDDKKQWSDAFQARWKREHQRGYFKKADDE